MIGKQIRRNVIEIDGLDMHKSPILYQKWVYRLYDVCVSLNRKLFMITMANNGDVVYMRRHIQQSIAIPCKSINRERKLKMPTIIIIIIINAVVVVVMVESKLVGVAWRLLSPSMQREMVDAFDHNVNIERLRVAFSSRPIQ